MTPGCKSLRLLSVTQRHMTRFQLCVLHRSGVVILAKVLLGCPHCGFYGVLCFFWYVRKGFHQTLEYFLVFCDFDVSFSPPSLDFMPPAIRFSVYVSEAGENTPSSVCASKFHPWLSRSPNSLHLLELPSSFVCLGPSWSPMQIPCLGPEFPTSIRRFLEVEGKKAAAGPPLITMS